MHTIYVVALPECVTVARGTGKNLFKVTNKSTDLQDPDDNEEGTSILPSQIHKSNSYRLFNFQCYLHITTRNVYTSLIAGCFVIDLTRAFHTRL